MTRLKCQIKSKFRKPKFSRKDSPGNLPSVRLFKITFILDIIFIRLWQDAEKANLPEAAQKCPDARPPKSRRMRRTWAYAATTCPVRSYPYTVSRLSGPIIFGTSF